MENSIEDLASEARKAEIRNKALANIADGKSAFDGAVEVLGITDPTDKAIMEELTGYEQKWNAIRLDENATSIQAMEIQSARLTLERILEKIGKQSYIEDLKIISDVDFTKAKERVRESNTIKVGE